MHLLTDPVAGAAAGIVAALLGVVLVVRSLTRGGPGRSGDVVFVAGAVVLALSVSFGLVGTVVADAVAARPRSTPVEVSVAVGVTAGVLLLCAGLLVRATSSWGRGELLRIALDALIIAAALWFVGWVLVSPPTALVGDVAVVLADVAAPGAAVACAVGVTVVVGLGASRARRRLRVAGLGVIGTALGGMVLAIAVSHRSVLGAVAAAVTLPVGLLAVTRVGDAERGPAPPGAAVFHRGTYAFVPMVALATAGMYHAVRHGEFTVVSVAAGSVAGFALVARQYLALRDVRRYAHRLAEREAHFRELAYTDPLTGLANRRAFMGELHREVDAGRPFVLVFLDLDGFKGINDLRGHDVGDAVLVEVGRRLRDQLPADAVACRLSGDEFAILLRGVSPVEVRPLAGRLLEVLSAPYVSAEVRLSVSIGMAGSMTASDVPTLLRNADLALRYAKQRGKNRCEEYDSEYDQRLRRRTTVEVELRGAVARGELHLVFQPVVAVPSVRPVGAEALLRWHHPVLGNVRPDEFIPLAEECGQIAQLGAWVLNEACRHLSRWLADGHDVWISVNVSPLELHTPEYAVRVAEALRRHRVPPQRLVLEVTEHAVATDLNELIRRLRALRDTGVRIALDDFGAGYSSLGQLRNLPIDILKIDHSLVTVGEPSEPSIPGRPAAAPMVDIVMRLGHQLGLEVIAEGVTNQAELRVVVEAGCRFGQGALFGRAVPAEHFEAMLEAATSAGARLVAPPRRSPPCQGRPSALPGPTTGPATPLPPAPGTPQSGAERPGDGSATSPGAPSAPRGEHRGTDAATPGAPPPGMAPPAAGTTTSESGGEFTDTFGPPYGIS